MNLVNLRPYFLSLLCLGLVWFVVSSAPWAWPLLIGGGVCGVLLGWRNPMRHHSSAERGAAILTGLALSGALTLLLRDSPQTVQIGVLVALASIVLPWVLVVALRARRKPTPA